MWNSEHQAPLAYKNNELVGYDDLQSFEIKAKYIVDMNLAGAMFWSLDLDDFSGTHCNQGKYPLINSVKSYFKNKKTKFITNYQYESQQYQTSSQVNSIQTQPVTNPTTTYSNIDNSVIVTTPVNNYQSPYETNQLINQAFQSYTGSIDTMKNFNEMMKTSQKPGKF